MHYVIIFVFTMLTLSPVADANPLPSARVELQSTARLYEKQSGLLYRSAEDIYGSHVNVGTANANIDYDKHRCFAMAALLGLKAAAQPLKVNYKPNFNLKTDDNAFEIALMAQSMSVFADVVRDVLKWSAHQLIEEWNLGCVYSTSLVDQKFALPFPQNAKFLLREGKTQLIVLGDIDDKFHDDFLAFLGKNPTITDVHLGSGGGDVQNALASGRIIRTLRLKTHLWNSCSSACVYLFLGGIERWIHDPYPALGFHRVSSQTLDGVRVAVAMNHPVYRDIFLFASDMGVDAAGLATLAAKAMPNDMHLIKFGKSRDDYLLCSLRIATNIQRGCEAPEHRFPNHNRKATRMKKSVL